MNRKLFAFDIDGTLLDTKKKPLKSTVLAINALRAQGHFVTLATGRSRFHAQTVIRDLHFDNYVLCNGAAAFLNHQQIFKQLLPKKALSEFVQETSRLAIDTSFIGLDEMRRATDFDQEMMMTAMRSFGSTMPQLDATFLDNEDVYQGLAFYGSAYENYFDDRYPELAFIRWHENCVDVIPKENSKARTILNVAKRLDMEDEDGICFGDGLNDREMLAAAGVGVAMGNASEEVKACADLVTDDNDHDGISKALKKMKVLKD